MSELSEIRALLRQLETKVDETLRRLAYIGEPDLTVKEFARRAGRSRTTIHEKINRFEIITRDGRIPVSELGKFVS